MVLRANQGIALHAIDHREEGRLLAVEEILHDDLGARGAKRRVHHHVVAGVESGLDIYRDDDALARGESVRFDDDGRSLLLMYFLAASGSVKRCTLRVGMLYFLRRSLRKPLEPLSLAASLVGPKHGMSAAMRASAMPSTRAPGTDHDEADIVVLAEFNDGGVVGVLDVHDLNAVLDDDAGVAGRAEELATSGACLRRQHRVPAPAAADDEDVHPCRPDAATARDHR